jgi:general secretion pathway protein H
MASPGVKVATPTSAPGSKGAPKGRALPAPAPQGGARKLGAARRFLPVAPKGRALPAPAPQGGARKLGAARHFLVRPGLRVGGAAGFTLIELLVVLLLVSIAGGLATLALRDPSSTVLEREAARLQAVLDGARAESRTSGRSLRALPALEGGGFRVVGDNNGQAKPWLDEATRADWPSAGLLLGPEPLLPPQRLRLRHGTMWLELASDGVGPFTVVASGGGGS